MSSDTITNFLEPKDKILEDIEARLNSIEEIKKTHIIAGDNFSELWKDIPQAQPPIAVVMYLGSKYDKNPRCEYKFSVIIAVRFTVSNKAAQIKCFKLIDKAIGVIDHNVFNEQVIYRAVEDKWLDYKNAGLTVYRIDFIAEDY